MRTPLQDWIAQEHGRRHYFNRDAVMAHLSLTEEAFEHERSWLLQHQWMAEYYPGFYTIAELLGSTNPYGPVMPQALYWLDGLMRYLQTPYRSSLWSAAYRYGATHQGVQRTDVLIPDTMLGDYPHMGPLIFTKQPEDIFYPVNANVEWVPERYQFGPENVAKVRIATPEVTLLDCVLMEIPGLDDIAQAALDIGAKIQPDRLAAAAACYPVATVQRLGHLLAEYHPEAAAPLLSIAQKATQRVNLYNGYISDGHCPPPPNVNDDRWGIYVNWKIDLDDPHHLDEWVHAKSIDEARKLADEIFKDL